MTARTLVAAHLLDPEHLWYAAHLLFNDPADNNIVWKPEPTFEFGEAEYLRWATLDEVRRSNAEAFLLEVND